MAPLPPIATGGATVNNAIAELAPIPRWVCWRTVMRNGKPTKAPFTPAGSPASSTDPTTWSDFNSCSIAAFVDSRFDGIGFVFTGNDNLFGVDLDDCVHDGQPDAVALDLITQLGSYAEISPSGHGLKIFARGKLPEAGRRNGKLEVYSEKRFFTVTGWHLGPSPERITAAQPAIDALWARHFAKPKSKASTTTGTLPPYADQAMIEALLKDSKAAAYWDQKFSVTPQGDASPSSWDLAFAGYLAHVGIERVEVARYLRAYRRHHEPSKGKQDRPSYIWGTVDQAFGNNIHTFNRTHQKPGSLNQPGSAIVTLTASQLIAMPFTPAESILGPWLRVKTLAMLFGPRGEGKTYLVIACALAIASGGQFLEWEAPKQRKVLFIDGEMPGISIKDRIRILWPKGFDTKALDDWFRIITPDSQPAGLILNLSRAEDHARIEDQIEWADVIILDNLACLTGGDENDREAWLPVQGWILQLRARGKTVILIHHSGKGGDQRGTSSREDVLDTVVRLKRPSDYEERQGLRCEWHFVKHRSFFGDDTTALEIQLTEDGVAGKKWDLEEA